MVDISIVIVNWNVRDLLRQCLRSIYADAGLGQSAQPCELEIIVVDNASTDGSVEMVQAEFPGVRLITNDHNRGFPAANNQGIAIAQGRHV